MKPLPKFIGPDIVGLAARGLERLRLEEGVDSAMILVGSGLGDDVDYPALRLPVLWLEAAGLDLNLFNETSVDADAHRPVAAREDAQSAKGRVSDVHAISDI